LAIKTLKSPEAKDIITQWDVYFSKLLSASSLDRKVTLAELQKIILWNLECDAASLIIPNYQALDRWKELLRITTEESAISNSWAVAHEIVKLVIHNGIMHLRIDPLKKDSKPRSENNRVKKAEHVLSESYDSVSLLAVFSDIGILESNVTELELLSKVPRLVLEMEMNHSINDFIDRNNNANEIVLDVDLGNNNDGNRSDCPSTCAMLLKVIDKLCFSIMNSSSGTDKSEVMRTKYDSFLARTYNSCLNWIQNYYQDKVSREKDKRDPIMNNLNITGRLVNVILSSLSTSFNSGECVGAILRATGNCMNYLPIGSYERVLGVNLCSNLEQCISSLLSKIVSNGWNILGKMAASTSGQGVLNTCLMLTSLVSSKCLTNNLYKSSSQLVVSCLVAVDTLQTSFEVSDADVSCVSCTVDMSVISRLLNFIVTTYSLSCLPSIHLDKEGPVETGACLNKICHSILMSSYALAFLHALCIDIVSKISHQTAAVSSDDIERTNARLPELFNDAQEMNVVTTNEASAMLLYCHSHFLWCVPSLYGAGDTSSLAVIDALKIAVEKLDPFLIEAVAVPRKKDRVKNSVKIIVQDIIVEESSVPSLAAALRIWVLLAQWSLPLTSNEVCTYT
jgi:hypothetical protein